VSRHLLTRRTVLEDGVQYSTVHIPNVFCDGHLQFVNCVRIVRIHGVFHRTPKKKIGQRKIRQGQGVTRLVLTPSVISSSNYVITVGDWNCLKYCIVACFLYWNRQSSGAQRLFDHPILTYVRTSRKILVFVLTSVVRQVCSTNCFASQNVCPFHNCCVLVRLLVLAAECCNWTAHGLYCRV